MGTWTEEMKEAAKTLIPDTEQENTQVEQTETSEAQPSEQQQEETVEAQANTESEDTTDSSLTQEQETEATTESVDGEASSPEETGDNAEDDNQPLEFDNVNDYVAHLIKEAEEDEELATLLKEHFAPKDNPYANEDIAKLNKFVAETGRGLREYQFINELDTTNMSFSEAVFYKASLENPELTSEELGLLIKDQYKLDEDEYSEREVQLGKIQLKKDGNEAVKYLNDLKGEYSKPVDGYTAPQSKTSSSPNLLGMDSEKFLSSLKEDTSLESFTFELDDNSNFEFKFDDTYGDGLYKALANDKDPLSFVRNNDGSLNTEELAKMVAFYQNGDKIVKSAYSQGKSDNAKSIATAKKNVDFNDERQDAPVPDAKNEQQEKYGEVLARMGFR